MRHGLAVALCLWTAAGHPPARSDQVEMADGRVLDGRFVLLPGVAADPAADARGNAPNGTPVLMCDNELTRTMVSKRRVVKAEPGVGNSNVERIKIPQRIPENGRRVASIGAILGTTPFDEYGRRILSIGTAGGRIDVVQGITQITPRWASVEGIITEQPLLLDMRIATSSIPREVRRTSPSIPSGWSSRSPTPAKRRGDRPAPRSHRFGSPAADRAAFFTGRTLRRRPTRTR